MRDEGRKGNGRGKIEERSKDNGRWTRGEKTTNLRTKG